MEGVGASPFFDKSNNKNNLFGQAPILSSRMPGPTEPPGWRRSGLKSISTRPNRWPGFQTTERFMSCRTRLQGSPPRFQTTKHPVHRECHRMLRSVCNQATFHPKKNCSNVEFNLSLCQCDRALTQTQGRGDSSKSRAQANDRQTKRHVHVDGSETWPMPAISSTI